MPGLARWAPSPSPRRYPLAARGVPALWETGMAGLNGLCHASTTCQLVVNPLNHLHVRQIVVSLIRHSARMLGRTRPACPLTLGGYRLSAFGGSYTLVSQEP